jgi:hypothetical protein
MLKDFNHFDALDNFDKDEFLGQYNSYEAYNNDLLLLADFYGRTPFDWYRNKITGEIIWLDGRAQIDNYSNLGHTWGKTFPNNDRILLDGETKLITYNGEILYNLNKKKSSFFSGAIAFSDGGAFQNPGLLPKGRRNVTWIDFGGGFEALTIIMGLTWRSYTLKGKGTNGGKRTPDDRTDDFINATDNGANTIKAVKSAIDESKNKKIETVEPKVKDSVTVLSYKNGKLINEERKPKL